METETAAPAGADEAVDGTVVDADAVEQPVGAEPPADEPRPAASSHALEVRAAGAPASRDVLMPLDTQQVVDGMSAYQEMLPRLLDDSDWQDAGRGERFVKKSGWRKIKRAFNISCSIVKQEIERAEDGSPVRAAVIVRAIAPNGQHEDGDGYCDVKESRFKNNKQKLENDLRATATTRAKNRAISDLVGMGEVSAEEAQGGGATAGPPWGPDSDEKMTEKGKRALAYLFDTGDGPDEQSAGEVYDELVKGNGYFPAATAGALFVTASKLKALLDERNAAAEEDLGEPSPDDDIPFGGAADDDTKDPGEEPDPNG